MLSNIQLVYKLLPMTKEESLSRLFFFNPLSLALSLPLSLPSHLFPNLFVEDSEWFVL